LRCRREFTVGTRRERDLLVEWFAALMTNAHK